MGCDLEVSTKETLSSVAFGHGAYHSNREAHQDSSHLGWTPRPDTEELWVWFGFPFGLCFWNVVASMELTLQECCQDHRMKLLVKGLHLLHTAALRGNCCTLVPIVWLARHVFLSGGVFSHWRRKPGHRHPRPLLFVVRICRSRGGRHGFLTLRLPYLTPVWSPQSWPFLVRPALEIHALERCIAP